MAPRPSRRQFPRAPMLERDVAHYGAVPTHAAFDGGYASRENVGAAKALGVAHRLG